MSPAGLNSYPRIVQTPTHCCPGAYGGWPAPSYTDSVCTHLTLPFGFAGNCKETVSCAITEIADPGTAECVCHEGMEPTAAGCKCTNPEEYAKWDLASGKHITCTKCPAVSSYSLLCYPVFRSRYSSHCCKVCVHSQDWSHSLHRDRSQQSWGLHASVLTEYGTKPATHALGARPALSLLRQPGDRSASAQGAKFLRGMDLQCSAWPVMKDSFLSLDQMGPSSARRGLLT